MREIHVFQEALDVLDIVERVVEVEFEMGDDAQLLTFAEAEAPPQVGRVLADELEEPLFGPLADNHQRDVDAGDGEVGGDAHLGDGDKRRTEDRLGLAEEDIAHILLDKAADFVLSCALHGFSFYQRQPTRMGRKTVCCIQATPMVA